jgi:hypothetical protein
MARCRVIDHALEIDDDRIFVANRPRIMPAWQQGYIARPAIEL